MSFLTDETLFSGTLNDSDVIHLVDVSNTTQNAAGSSFKLTIGQLKAAIPNIYTADGTLSGTRTITQDGFALNFIGGNIGIGVTPSDTDTRLHIQGVDSTSSNYVIKLKNSASGNLFSLRNDGSGLHLDMNFGKGYGNVATSMAWGVNALNAGGLYGNTAIGHSSLQSNTGYENTALGYNALSANTSGRWNTGVGSSAMANNLGERNTGVGVEAGAGTNAGGYNTAMGFKALTQASGGGNTALGAQTLYENTSGVSNTAIGNNAMAGVNSTGSYNASVGEFSMYQNNGSYNTAIGAKAGYTNQTGDNNIFIGYYTARYLTAGSQNSIIGSNVTFLRDDAFNAVNAWNNTLSNNVILADGSGNVRMQIDSSGNTKHKGNSVGLLLEQTALSLPVVHAIGGTLAADTYYYYITALNDTGETHTSPHQPATTTGATSSVDLVWNAVKGATSYRIYRRKLSDGAGVTAEYYDIAGGATTTYTDTNAAVDGTANPNLTATAYVTKQTSEFTLVNNLPAADIALITAKKGMIVFNTDTDKHQGYDGTTWNNMY